MSKDTRTRLCGSCEATVSGGEIPSLVPHETFYQGAASHMAPFLWGGTAERQGRDLMEESQATCWVEHFPSWTS